MFEHKQIAWQYNGLPLIYCPHGCLKVSRLFIWSQASVTSIMTNILRVFLLLLVKDKRGYCEYMLWRTRWWPARLLEKVHVTRKFWSGMVVTNIHRRKSEEERLSLKLMAGRNLKITSFLIFLKSDFMVFFMTRLVIFIWINVGGRTYFGPKWKKITFSKMLIANKQPNWKIMLFQYIYEAEAK
jgi:hypothetical protein